MLASTETEDRKMPRNIHKLTEEQIAELRKSPYVRSIGEDYVHFTAQFKQKFW
jgi:hypothetical protein